MNILNKEIVSITMKDIRTSKKMRVGMYLGFEGLSFKIEGKNHGLEVEAIELLATEMKKLLGWEFEIEIINQEWSQIIDFLKERKYHVVFSALIPSAMYQRYFVKFTQPYLSTAIVIATQKKNGSPSLGITEDISSLQDKLLVVINDPAARRGLRSVGVYVPGDEAKPDSTMFFPLNKTKAEMERNRKLYEYHNEPIPHYPLIPVKEILQLDDMPDIYEAIAKGEVDAGVIDLGIIWYVSTVSKRYSDRIYAFKKPVARYIYSAVTNRDDEDLNEILDRAIGELKKKPEFKKLVMKWHGDQFWDWRYMPEDFILR